MPACPFCAEPIEAGCRKCPHCGETLVDRADLVAWLADVAPDAAFAEQVREWPDDSLLRALGAHVDEYEPSRQRALVDEARRRGLPLPRRLPPLGPSLLAPALPLVAPARSLWDPAGVTCVVIFLLAVLVVVLFA